MKCQILFSGKNNNNIITLSSAKFAHRVVKVISYSGYLSFFRVLLIGEATTQQA